MELAFVLMAGAVVGFLAFGALGAFIARQKRRSAMEGLLVGGLFGPLGVIVELFLPTLTPTPTPKRVRPVWVQPDFPEERPAKAKPKPVSQEEEAAARWLQN